MTRNTFFSLCIVVLSLFHSAYGGILHKGCCDAQGNLAYGATPLDIQNRNNILQVVTDKPYKELKELRNYLGANSLGRTRAKNASDAGSSRYDAWGYCTINRNSSEVNRYYLLVESQRNKVLRLAYASWSKSGIYLTGDKELINAIKNGMNENCIEQSARAFIAASKHLDKAVHAYNHYIRRGGDPKRFYIPAPTRNTPMPSISPSAGGENAS